MAKNSAAAATSAASQASDATHSATAAGGAQGSFGLADCLAEGFAAGRAAAAAAGFDGPAGEAPETTPEPAEAPLKPLWVVPSDRPVGRGHKHFVDHQNDVTAADVLLAAREGYRQGRRAAPAVGPLLAGR